MVRCMMLGAFGCIMVDIMLKVLQFKPSYMPGPLDPGVGGKTANSNTLKIAWSAWLFPGD